MSVSTGPTNNMHDPVSFDIVKGLWHSTQWLSALYNCHTRQSYMLLLLWRCRESDGYQWHLAASNLRCLLKYSQNVCQSSIIHLHTLNEWSTRPANKSSHVYIWPDATICRAGAASTVTDNAHRAIKIEVPIGLLLSLLDELRICQIWTVYNVQARK